MRAYGRGRGRRIAPPSAARRHKRHYESSSKLGSVRGLLSSPRRRRRLLTGGIALLVVGGVTFSMIHWSNTSHYHMAPIRYNEKAQVVVAPVKAPFGVAKRQGVLKVAAAFVNTAVRRKHVER